MLKLALSNQREGLLFKNIFNLILHSPTVPFLNPLYVTSTQTWINCEIHPQCVYVVRFMFGWKSIKLI